MWADSSVVNGYFVQQDFFSVFSEQQNVASAFAAAAQHDP